MSTPACLLHHVQQPSNASVRFHAVGRLDERGGRIAKVQLLPEAIIMASTPHATVAVNLKAIPTEAPWPRSKSHNEICALMNLCNTEKIMAHHDAGPYPYPDIDGATVFFIPSEAVVCKLQKGGEEGEEIVQCEGYYDCERDALRLDAVDRDRHSWFWMSVRVAA
jgi:hypothetical protein